MTIFQMSLLGAILIIAVVIIRALTLHKLPKKTFLILWGVVIYRLLIPFSISSRFSFYTGIDLLKQAVSEKAAVTVPLSITGNAEASARAENLAPTAVVSPITVIWLVGVFACMLFFVIAYVKCRREFRTSTPVESDFAVLWLKEHQTRRPVQIRQCDKIKAPLTYGVFRPVVLLPKAVDWTDETKLRYILTHEFVHVRRFDALTKLLLTAALCVHWFNPLVWVMYVLANRDIELSCDETVVRTFGENLKSAYAMMLIGMEEKKNRITPLVNNFSKNAIEERIISIMKIKKMSIAGIILALVLVVGTTIMFATNTAKAADDTGGIYTTDFYNDENGSTWYSQIATNTASATVMSYTDESGRVKISTDDGKTWMSEEEFKKAYPTPEVVWWTYDEYKTWLEQEKVVLQNIIGQKGWTQTDGWFVWTQEKADEAIKQYEKILQDIKDGIKVSKTVNGNDNIVMSINPSEIDTTSCYGIMVVDNMRNEKNLGSYDSKENLFDAVKPYCDNQVKNGNMKQSEADEIISKVKAMQ